MAQPAINLFTLHDRNWRNNRYVYPVISRRSRGLSIGVNLNPDKICNFDCVYCCVDRTEMPGKVEVDLNVLAAELGHMIGHVNSGAIWKEPPFDQTPGELRRLNDIAFSGDGEPTSFAGFGEACTIAADLLEQAKRSDVKIVVITNATLFAQPRVQQAIEFLDHHNGQLWAKLDAGTQEYYQFIERTGIPLSRVLANIALIGKNRPIVIQSLFMKVHGTGPDENEIAQYIQRLAELKEQQTQIDLVQVYTVARRTAEDWVTPLENLQVDAIRDRVRAIGLKAESFYGPN